MLNDNYFFLNDLCGQKNYPSQANYVNIYEQMMKEKQRRQIAAALEEEERRRYYMQAMKEKEAYLNKIRRIQSLETKKKMFLEKQRRIQEEEAIRRIMFEEADKRRHRDLYEEKSEEDDSPHDLSGPSRFTKVHELMSQPQNVIVQGSDGRLYHILLGSDEGLRNNLDHETFLPRNGNCNEVEQSHPIKKHLGLPQRSEMTRRKVAINTNDDESTSFGPVDRHKKEDEVKPLGKNIASNSSKDIIDKREVSTTKTRKPTRFKSSILVGDVEDASDDEMEEDSLRSVWRNRLPSEGQWMEPVKEYE